MHAVAARKQRSSTAAAGLTIAVHWKLAATWRTAERPQHPIMNQLSPAEEAGKVSHGLQATATRPASLASLTTGPAQDASQSSTGGRANTTVAPGQQGGSCCCRNPPHPNGPLGPLLGIEAWLSTCRALSRRCSILPAMLSMALRQVQAHGAGGSRYASVTSCACTSLSSRRSPPAVCCCGCCVRAMMAAPLLLLLPPCWPLSCRPLAACVGTHCCCWWRLARHTAGSGQPE